MRSDAQQGEFLDLTNLGSGLTSIRPLFWGSVNEVSVSTMDDQNIPHLPICGFFNGPSHVSGSPLPCFWLDLRLENSPRSPAHGGIGYSDDYGCCPLDVSQKSRDSPLDHGARGDDPLYRFQRRHGGPKPLRALLVLGRSSLLSGPEWYSFTDFEYPVLLVPDISADSIS